MTSKQIYEAISIELNKIQAPALKLYEFNYFLNQAINQFVNKIYNIYDINQQTTDDLRVLKSTATLLPQPVKETGINAIDYLHKGTYFIEMPDDYLHLLNCVCLFDVNKKKECWKEGDVMVVGATKLTSDNWSEIINDVYNRPSKKRPYYYIHNQNDIRVNENENILADNNNQLPTNSFTDRLPYTTTQNEETIYTGFNRTFDFNDSEYGIKSLSSVEKPAGSRHSNSSKVRIEIRCGKDKSDIFSLSAIQIDYVKSPQHVELTQEQLDSIQDISQIMEFPEYVNKEIINELVNLIMRRNNNPSLNAHMQITQSIARPTGQQQ